jgi:muramoyltetrapeptide carboxypeptidase
VAVVAPASAANREELDRGLAELRRLGYEPVCDPSVFEVGPFSAGSAAVRAEAFRRVWEDPSIAAVIAERGGYGSVHLLPLLDGWRPEETPKLFIGYSDNTSLLSWLGCQRGLAVLHGPTVDRLGRGDTAYHRESLLQLAQGRGIGFELQPDGLLVLKSGTTSGRMFGGTLTLLTASLGTPYAFDPPPGCVLFIEDVNERPYRLDRMLTQLRLSGVLAKASGLVFGEMRGCGEPSGAVTALDAVRDATLDFDGPVVWGFPSGHSAGPCWTLPFGVQVSVTTSPRALVRVEESPVV